MEGNSKASHCIKALSVKCRSLSKIDSIARAIKRAINQLVRAKLISSGMNDLESGVSVARSKPIVMCVLEWFKSTHSVYGTHSVSLEALKEK